MYAIYRSESANRSLKETWQRASNDLREAILVATDRMNQRLFEHPQEEGESREGATRILFEEPVAALFEVDEASRSVRILRTWAYGHSVKGPFNDVGGY